MRHLISLLLCSAALCTGKADITIDHARGTGKVPQLLFGHNIVGADQKGIFGAAATPIKTRTGDGIWDPIRMRPNAEAVRLSREISVRALRYPGGCLAHNWRWQDSVGPLSARSNFAFGIDEFIAFCRAVGAEPVITASDYAATPADNAALIEYLNAVADSKHPWAEKRAAWGNREPYNVRYIEIGNESYHGNHDVIPFRKFSAAEYAVFFNECAVHMKKTDPAVKLGALILNNGEDDIDPTWNTTVLTKTRDTADFIIIHTYAVRASLDTAPLDVLARAAMASGEQFETMLANYRKLIDTHSRTGLPLFITEYNANLVNDKERMNEIMDYRFSLASALFNADYLRIVMKPEYAVAMANYWQYINGSFGMLRTSVEDIARGREPPWKTMSAYHFFRLWANHFGTTQVHVSVNGPSIEFEGVGKNVLPARAAFTEKIPQVVLTAGEMKGMRWDVTGNGIRVAVDDLIGNAYPVLGTCPLRPGGIYRLSFRAKVISGDAADARIGLGLIDDRGWERTKCGVGIDGIEKARSVVSLSGVMAAKNDTTGANPVFRIASKKKMSAVIDITDITVTPENPFPPYAAVTAAASISDAKDTLYVIAFNKHHAENIPVTISLASGRAQRARVWTVSGPSLTANNRTKEEVRETVSGDSVKIENGAIRYELPKHSMSAFEIATAP